MKTYKKLKIYKESLDLAIAVYKMTIDSSLYAEGQRLRMSAEAVKKTIVEAFVEDRQKDIYAKYLTKALAETFETKEQLEWLLENDYFEREKDFQVLYKKYRELAKDIYRFRELVNSNSFSLQSLQVT